MDKQLTPCIKLNKIISLFAMQYVHNLLRKEIRRNAKIWVHEWLSRKENLRACTRLRHFYTP